MGTPNNNGLSKNKCIPEKGGQSSICCAESGNREGRPGVDRAVLRRLGSGLAKHFITHYKVQRRNYAHAQNHVIRIRIRAQYEFSKIGDTSCRYTATMQTLEIWKPLYQVFQ